MAKFVHFKNASSTNKDSYLGDGWFSIVMHGGGGTMWTESFPVVSHIQNYVQDVYSIEIPFHGSSTPTDQQSIPNADEIISQVITSTLKILQIRNQNSSLKHKILFCGYSFGALLLMHVWLYLQKHEFIDPTSIGILIGCSTSSSNPQLLKFYHKWWSHEEFERRGKSKQMAQLHGPQWRSTTELVRSWLDEKSAIWLRKEEVTELFSIKKNPYLFFIEGEEDQVFPVMELASRLPLENVARRVMVVPSDHFSYFLPSKWIFIQKSIEMAVLMSTADSNVKSKL